jgi:hypothetical protein
MTNSPHFLGYSRLGVERTKGAADQREQFDIATPFENRWDARQARVFITSLGSVSGVSVLAFASLKQSALPIRPLRGGGMNYDS